MTDRGQRLESSWLVSAIVLALALAVNLPHVLEIGLFNDDVVIYLQPDHAAQSHPLQFVLRDSTTSLRSGERPAAYVPFFLGRLAYCLGVPYLVGLQMLLAAIAASLVAGFFRHFSDSASAALIAGAAALLWPVSPLIQFWPSTMHYPFATGLSIVAAELALSGSPVKRAFAVVVHVLAALTLESYIVAAPVLVVAVLLARRVGGKTAPEGRHSRIPPRIAATSAAWMLSATSAVLAWRFVLLPRIGAHGMHYESQIVPWRNALRRIPEGLRFLIDPWPRALRSSSELTDVAQPILQVATVAVAVGFAFALAFLLRRAGSRPANPRFDYRAAMMLAPCGLVLLHWVGIQVWIPGSLQATVGLASRLDYPTLVGIALCVGGVAHLLLCLAAGWTGRVLRAAVVVGSSALVVFGVGFQRRVLAGHANDWQRTQIILDLIGQRCPSIATNTLVVLDSDWPTSLLRVDRPGRLGMSHQVLSSLLIARYDDPTLRGVRKRELVVTDEGVFPLHFGGELTWFPEGAYGPLNADATELDRPLDPERVLVLGWGRDEQFGIRPGLSVWKNGKASGSVESQGKRCGSSPTQPSPAFCHAFPGFCSGQRGARARNGSPVPDR